MPPRKLHGDVCRTGSYMLTRTSERYHSPSYIGLPDWCSGGRRLDCHSNSVGGKDQQCGPTTAMAVAIATIVDDYVQLLRVKSRTFMDAGTVVVLSGRRVCCEPHKNQSL